jgi:hypothetical protein
VVKDRVEQRQVGLRYEAQSASAGRFGDGNEKRDKRLTLAGTFRDYGFISGIDYVARFRDHSYLGDSA